VIASVGTFSWQGTTSFLPKVLVKYRGLSSMTAGFLFSSYFVVQAVVKPGLGRLSDDYGLDLAIGRSRVTSAVGMAFFVIVPGLVGVGAALVLVGIGLRMGVTVEPRFVDELSESEQGVGFGLVRTVYLVVSSLGSVAVGFLSDVFRRATAFLFVVALLSVVLCALVINSAFDRGY